MATDELRPVRFSRLKAIAASPLHYRAASSRPDTAAMRKGRAIHSYMLGNPDAVLLYSGRRAGKEWETFRAAHPDDEIVIASELEAADSMREALLAHRPSVGPSAMELLTSGRRERKLRWSFLGRECAGTPDVAGRRLVELKSCRCADPWRFVRDGQRMGYDAQCAWYWDALTAVGTPPSEAWIVAVESAEPYAVQVFRVTERALGAGRAKWHAWLERLLVCEASNYWPAYMDGPADFDDEDGGLTLKIGGQDVTLGAEPAAVDELDGMF